MCVWTVDVVSLLNWVKRESGGLWGWMRIMGTSTKNSPVSYSIETGPSTHHVCAHYQLPPKLIPIYQHFVHALLKFGSLSAWLGTC